MQYSQCNIVIKRFINLSTDINGRALAFEPLIWKNGMRKQKDLYNFFCVGTFKIESISMDSRRTKIFGHQVYLLFETFSVIINHIRYMKYYAMRIFKIFGKMPTRKVHLDKKRDWTDPKC